MVWPAREHGVEFLRPGTSRGVSLSGFRERRQLRRMPRLLGQVGADRGFSLEGSASTEGTALLKMNKLCLEPAEVDSFSIGGRV